MRSDRFGELDRDSEWDAGLNRSSDHDGEPSDWDLVVANSNSPDEVFGELGFVLVVVLGFVLAINMMLVALHIS